MGLFQKFFMGLIYARKNIWHSGNTLSVNGLNDIYKKLCQLDTSYS